MAAFKRTTASHGEGRGKEEGGELATYSKLSHSLHRMWQQKEEEEGGVKKKIKKKRGNACENKLRAPVG